MQGIHGAQTELGPQTNRLVNHAQVVRNHFNAGRMFDER